MKNICANCTECNYCIKNAGKCWKIHFVHFSICIVRASNRMSAYL